VNILVAVSLAAVLLYGTTASAHPGDHHSVEELDALLIDNPTEASLLIARGALHTRLGHWDEAEQDLLQAQDASDEATVAFELANLYYRTGSYRKSLAYINHFIDANPQYPPAFLLRARTAEASQQIDTAINSYRTYLDIAQAPHPGDYLASAELLASTGTEGIVGAIELLDAGIKKIGLTPQLQRYAMQLELKREQKENAITRWQSLEDQLGNTLQYKITLARLLILANKINEAKTILVLAKLQLSNMRSTPARISLGMELARMERRLE